MKKRLFPSLLGGALVATALSACSGDPEMTTPEPPKTTLRDTLPPGASAADRQAIGDMRIDYSLALRSAAIRLTGNLPTLTDIEGVQNAPDKKVAYEQIIDQYLAAPRFSAQMIGFFKNTFRSGGGQVLIPDPFAAGNETVNLNYAPNFAAKLVVTEADFRQLVTATTGTCVTFTEPNFGDDSKSPDCVNQAATVGILTDAGILAQFFATLNFRRLRWIQETLTCAKFPAETNGEKIQFIGGVYSSPWDINSISGTDTAGATVDFKSTSSVICATCHGTMNHQAPLFAKFDYGGRFVEGKILQVPSAISGQRANLIEWLPVSENEKTAWRFDKPAPDLKAFGAAIAADPQFTQCIANRVWNWALSRGDAVNDQRTLTPALASQLVSTLTTNNWNVKALIRETFKSPVFIRY